MLTITCRIAALQGAFQEHINMLARLRLPLELGGPRLNVFAVRTKEDLEACCEYRSFAQPRYPPSPPLRSLIALVWRLACLLLCCSRSCHSGWCVAT